jgi:hypothetical protein
MNKVYCVETGRYQNQASVKEYKITGATQLLGSIRCAVLSKEGDDKTYLKPWDQITNLKVPGEGNINAKLTTRQVRAIVKEAYTKTRDETTFKELGEKYGVNASHISDIVHGRSWRHVTVGLIQQFEKGNIEVLDSVVSASNDMKRKTTKLNGSLAKFMVRDHYLNKIPVKKLAQKYLVSESSARRVVTGKAWNKATIPAIAEYSKWSK